MRMRMRNLPLLMLALLLCGCSSGVPLALVNASGVPLVDVTLSGTGFSQAIGTVAPGETVRARVSPTSESGVAVSFTAGRRRVHVPEQGYVEPTGHYRIKITVKPDFSASVDTGMGNR